MVILLVREVAYMFVNCIMEPHAERVFGGCASRFGLLVGQKVTCRMRSRKQLMQCNSTPVCMAFNAPGDV